MKSVFLFIPYFLFFISAVAAGENEKYQLILTGTAVAPDGMTFHPEQFRIWLATSSETYPSKVSFDRNHKFTALFPKAPAGKYTLYSGIFVLDENAQIAKAFQHGFVVDGNTQSMMDLGNVVMVKKSFLPNGTPAPLFEEKSVSGETISLKEYKGKYVLLDFWASWCGHCKAAMPEIKALYNQYHKKHGLEIIGMSLDTNVDDLKAYIKDNEIPWQQIVIGGFDHQLIKDYSIIAIPSEILIGPDGKVVKKGLKGEHGIQAYFSKIWEIK